MGEEMPVGRVSDSLEKVRSKMAAWMGNARRHPSLWAWLAVGAVALSVLTAQVARYPGTRQTAGKETSETVSGKEKEPVIYKNKEYGFTFDLPESWRGFHIAVDRWEGRSLKDEKGEVVASGHIILIRSPNWTSAKPTQDIPIMVFTTAQWNALQKGEISVGAAPILPSELGHNKKYVFALPARYNYGFLPGYEEVEKILQGGALKAFDP